MLCTNWPPLHSGTHHLQTGYASWRVPQLLPDYCTAEGTGFLPRGKLGCACSRHPDGKHSKLPHWTCVDLVAALQPSDLVSFMANLHMQTLFRACLTLSSFFLAFSSCVIVLLLSAWGRLVVSSFLPSLLIFTPSRRSWHFCLNASFFFL